MLDNGKAAAQTFNHVHLAIDTVGSIYDLASADTLSLVTRNVSAITRTDTLSLVTRNISPVTRNERQTTRKLGDLSRNIAWIILQQMACHTRACRRGAAALD